MTGIDSAAGHIRSALVLLTNARRDLGDAAYRASLAPVTDRTALKAACRGYVELNAVTHDLHAVLRALTEVHDDGP